MIPTDPLAALISDYLASRDPATSNALRRLVRDGVKSEGPVRHAGYVWHLKYGDLAKTRTREIARSPKAPTRKEYKEIVESRRRLVLAC